MNLEKRLEGLPMRMLALATWLLVFAACTFLVGAGAVLAEEGRSLPKPRGPYWVGRLVEDWADESRVDPLAPAPGIKRELPVVIWYPAERTASTRTSYYPPALSNVIARLQGAASPRMKASGLDVWSTAEAPVASDGRSYPVILLKPAFGALAVDYSVLAEDLASHGYVVVASDSPYTAPFVAYEDGRISERTPAGAGRGQGEPDPLAPGQPNGLSLPVLKVWVEDFAFMLSRLAGLNVDGSSHHLKGRLDLRSVGAVGHSFGGAASLEFCRVDPSCGAAIDIDGAPLGEVVRTGSPKPSLFILSERPDEQRTAAGEELFAVIDKIRAGLPNRPNQVTIAKSRHFNFSDQALYADLELSRRTGTLGPITPDQALVMANTLVRAFFDEHLKSEGGAFERAAAGLAGVQLDPLAQRP